MRFPSKPKIPCDECDPSSILSPEGFQRAGTRIERELFSGYRPIIFFILVYLVGSYMEARPDVFPVWIWQGLFTAVFLYAGTWCIRNFVHCREAHCVVTGTGFTGIGLLSLLSMLGAISFSDWSVYWLAFLAVYIAGMIFQYEYYSRKHSIQIGPTLIKSVPATRCADCGCMVSECQSSPSASDCPNCTLASCCCWSAKL